MRLPIINKHNKISTASFLKWYIIERIKGRGEKALKEIQWRFDKLDKNVKKIIIIALLSSGKEERAWVYKQLYDYWDNAFMNKIKEVFETYHETDCCSIIINYFPISYIQEHMDELYVCYDLLSLRLISDHVDFFPDWKRLFLGCPSSALPILELPDLKISDSEASDILYGTVHIFATIAFLGHDIDKYIKKRGEPVVPSALDIFSCLIDILVSKGCNQAVNKFYEWEKELYLTIKNSDTFIKFNEKGKTNKCGIMCITKKYYYRMLPDKYKSPTDSIIDWFEDDLSYVKKMEDINPNLTLLIDKLGLETTDY